MPITKAELPIHEEGQATSVISSVAEDMEAILDRAAEVLGFETIELALKGDPSAIETITQTVHQNGWAEATPPECSLTELVMQALGWASLTSGRCLL